MAIWTRLANPETIQFKGWNILFIGKLLIYDDDALLLICMYLLT